MKLGKLLNKSNKSPSTLGMKVSLWMGRFLYILIPKTVTSPLRTIRSTKVVVQTDNLGELIFEINPEGDKTNERVSVETMMTVIVQHEIDHLDGITIRDRVYSTTRTVRKNYGRNDLIVMKSTDGEMVEVKYKNANKYFLQGYEVV